MPRLLPAFDPYEDRRSVGLDMATLAQVAIVGTGALALGELFRQSAAPAAPGAAPQTAVVPVGDPTGLPEALPATVLPAGVALVSESVTPASVLEPGGTGFEFADPVSPDGVPGLLGDTGPGDTSPADGATGGGGGGGAPTGAAGDLSGASSGGGSGGGAGNSGGSSSGPGAAPGGGTGADFSPVAPLAAAPGTGSATTGTSTRAAVTGRVTSTPAASTGAPQDPAGGGGQAALTVAGATNISRTYATLPLPFEPNLGQTDAAVQFLSHSAGFQFYLAGSTATLALTRPGQDARATAVTRDVLRLSLTGGTAAPRVLPGDQQTGRSNYFGGTAAALTDVPQYGKIVEQDVYAGIDVVWHSTADRQLEYDLVVNPGADPSAIRLHLAGASGLSTDVQGNLLIGTGGGPLVQLAPTLYQTGANNVRQSVSGGHVLRPDGDVGFQVGDYDHTRPLVIDPVLVYSTYLGGSGNDKAYAVAADGAGDTYITGSTTSLDFPTSTGAIQSGLSGASDAFVTKLNAAGSAYVYSTYLGGSSTCTCEQGTGIAVDPAGSAYVVGLTDSANFPTTAGAFESTGASNGSTSFVTKLGAAGDLLLYSIYFGIGGTNAAAVAVDGQGRAYVTGMTNYANGLATHFPVTPGAFQTAPGSTSYGNAFVSELTAGGSALIYSTYLAGVSGSQATGIALDRTGAAYVVGGTNSTNFPTTAGAYQPSAPGGCSDGFVTKVNPGGGSLAYSTYLGGSSSDSAAAVAVDWSGDAFVTGSTSSFNFPTTASAYQTAEAGSGDAFVTELNPGGTGLVYSTYLGGSMGTSAGAGIAVDRPGYAVVTGTTNDQGYYGMGAFPTTSAAAQTGYGGGSQDAFVTRVSPGGTALDYSSYLGGAGDDEGTGVAMDAFGNAYLAGFTNSTNFPTKNPVQGSLSGGSAYDAWVTKVSPRPAPPVFTSVTGGVSTPTGPVTASQNLTLGGTATAGATVTVSRSDLGVLGTATADGSGNFSYDCTSTTLADGTYAFTATATSGGLTSDPAPAYLVTVDTTPPAVALTAPSSTTSLAPVVQVTSTGCRTGRRWPSTPTGTTTATLPTRARPATPRPTSAAAPPSSCCRA